MVLVVSPPVIALGDLRAPLPAGRFLYVSQIGTCERIRDNTDVSGIGAGTRCDGSATHRSGVNLSSLW